MSHTRLPYDVAALLLYRHVCGEQLAVEELGYLEKWRESSVYNKMLLYDLENDLYLRSLVTNLHSADPDLFWSTVVTYRAALHGGMAPPAGNFWQRLFKPIEHLLRITH